MPEPIQSFDFSVLDWIQSNLRNDVLDFIVPRITFLGNAGLIWILLTLVCVGVKKWRKCGLTMAAALLTGLLVGNIILKLLAGAVKVLIIKEYNLGEQNGFLALGFALSSTANVEHGNGGKFSKSSGTCSCSNSNERIIAS